jgi:hemolysin III
MHLMMIMRRIKDPVSGWSHFVGVLFGILALVLLVYQSVVRGTPLHTFSFAVYGASLIILYAAMIWSFYLTYKELKLQYCRTTPLKDLFVFILPIRN